MTAVCRRRRRKLGSPCSAPGRGLLRFVPSLPDELVRNVGPFGPWRHSLALVDCNFVGPRTLTINARLGSLVSGLKRFVHCHHLPRVCRTHCSIKPTTYWCQAHPAYSIWRAGLDKPRHGQPRCTRSDRCRDPRGPRGSPSSIQCGGGVALRTFSQN